MKSSKMEIPKAVSEEESIAFDLAALRKVQPDWDEALRLERVIRRLEQDGSSSGLSKIKVIFGKETLAKAKELLVARKANEHLNQLQSHLKKLASDSQRAKIERVNGSLLAADRALLISESVVKRSEASKQPSRDAASASKNKNENQVSCGKSFAFSPPQSLTIHRAP